MTATFRFFTSSGLKGAVRDQVQELLDLCNAYESLDIPIFPDHLESKRAAITAICAYAHDQLVGFGAIPDDDEPEACLMVHPNHRNSGIGNEILTTIRAECQRRGLVSFLIITDQSSGSGKAFLTATGIPYESSEFRLKLDEAAIDRSRPRIEHLRLRPAMPGDDHAVIQVLTSAFGQTDNEAEAAVARTIAEPRRRFFLAELNGEPIGTLRVGEWDGAGDITAFGVISAQQGKGYGRQILLDAVDLLLEQGFRETFIEVATDNASALGLYQSCGFNIASEFGYYRLMTNPDS